MWKAESLARRRDAYARKKQEKDRSQSRRTLERELQSSLESPRARGRRLNGWLVETRSSVARSAKNMRRDYRTSTARTMLRKKADRRRITERTKAIMKADKRTSAARTQLRKKSDSRSSSMRGEKQMECDTRQSKDRTALLLKADRRPSASRSASNLQENYRSDELKNMQEPLDAMFDIPLRRFAPNAGSGDCFFLCIDQATGIACFRRGAPYPRR